MDEWLDRYPSGCPDHSSRYNIVSEDDLVEANEKVLAFLCEAIRESKIEKLKEYSMATGISSHSKRARRER